MITSLIIGCNNSITSHQLSIRFLLIVVCPCRTSGRNGAETYGVVVDTSVDPVPLNVLYNPFREVTPVQPGEGCATFTLKTSFKQRICLQGDHSKMGLRSRSNSDLNIEILLQTPPGRHHRPCDQM